MVRSPLDHPHLILLSDLHHIAVVTVAAGAVEVEETGIGAVDALSMMIVIGTGHPLGLALKRGDIETGTTVTANATIGISIQKTAHETRETTVICVTAKAGLNQRELRMNHRK